MRKSSCSNPSAVFCATYFPPCIWQRTEFDFPFNSPSLWQNKHLELFQSVPVTAYPREMCKYSSGWAEVSRKYCNGFADVTINLSVTSLTHDLLIYGLDCENWAGGGNVIGFSFSNNSVRLFIESWNWSFLAQMIFARSGWKLINYSKLVDVRDTCLFCIGNIWKWPQQLSLATDGLWITQAEFFICCYTIKELSSGIRFVSQIDIAVALFCAWKSLIFQVALWCRK